MSVHKLFPPRASALTLAFESVVDGDVPAVTPTLRAMILEHHDVMRGFVAQQRATIQSNEALTLEARAAMIADLDRWSAS